MRDYSLNHLSDVVLLRRLSELVARDRVTTAELLAHIAEVDSRRLYAGVGYPSMFAYCVEELHLSEDAAYKRIQAARIGRQFPVLFAAIAEGNLHLAGLCQIAPYATRENVDDLIASATNKSKSEIEEFLVCRFGVSQAPARVRLLTPVPVQLAPAQVESGNATMDAFAEPAPVHAGDMSGTATPGELAPGQVERPKAKTEPERFLLQLMIDRETREKLQHAIALLSHVSPRGDPALVLDRALDSLIRDLERKRFGVPRNAPRKPGLS
jgi:hypothetical protein